MKYQKHLGLMIVIMAIAGSIFYFESQKPDEASIVGSHIQVMPKEEKEKLYPTAIEISNPSGFINTPLDDNGQSAPIKISDYIGKKVILVDFWTYSCINCQRTTPYLNAWWERYKDKGLIIIGVHTPEFDFEKDYDNVLAAAQKFGINYPVVLDNDYSTWRAYNNRYWPRKYLIDIDGYIVYDHIGEGAYDETENKIQDLLKERLAILGEEGEIPDDEVETTTISLAGQNHSPEIYFGALRNDYLGNGIRNEVGAGTFTVPVSEPPINTLYLSGGWKIEDEYAQNKTSNAKIIFKYKGQSVNIVAEADKNVRIRILKDGELVKAGVGAGIDVDSNGRVIVNESRLYNIISDSQGEHLLEIIIESPGLRVYTLTFG